MKNPNASSPKTAILQAPITTEVSYYIHYVPTGEWQKAIAFFQNTLGLMLRTDADGKWAEFNAGGITFALHPAGEGGVKPKETGICFAVDSCDDAAADLRTRGVDGVTDPKAAGERGRCFDFKDPFGNTFSAYGK